MMKERHINYLFHPNNSGAILHCCCFLRYESCWKIICERWPILGSYWNAILLMKDFGGHCPGEPMVASVVVLGVVTLKWNIIGHLQFTYHNSWECHNCRRIMVSSILGCQVSFISQNVIQNQMIKKWDENVKYSWDSSNQSIT